MPELPEVESVARDLRRAGLMGRQITGLTVRWPKTLDRPSEEEARAALIGARVVDVRRRGKFIILELSTGMALLIHLRMTGQLDVQRADQPLDPHHHLLLGLDEGEELRFRDTRKFGRWYVVENAAEIVDALGPEPIDETFTLARFRAMMAGRSGMLKPLLLNQKFVAGLGNIYVDEALFRARLHPEQRADSVDDAGLTALFHAMRDVLWEAIGNHGTSLGEGSTNYLSVAGRRGNNKDNLRVFRRTGEPCPDCGTPIERLIVGQRSSHICPACQPL
ncbi:MAG: bifunctional DNA-formamidopyrimidine glycosylase/DNA-(apurinic or apyrimidinic site) lyase [Anaerolineales bacterium]|nr:bifunctional DNA-formamidopyrimidine glycosylase/DNA-(apurinic or apyrimidinic site) lyase [Anaerolineales bacterium]MCB9172462.1 bifunctional DNA-formamidopyrimidine glycosylase/DNA-(apurinic or apyrimidinic site) lyase [Ardenticatenales bacterium]